MWEDIPFVKIFSWRRHELTWSRIGVIHIEWGSPSLEKPPYHWFHVRPLASPTVSPSLSSPTSHKWVHNATFWVKVFTSSNSNSWMLILLFDRSSSAQQIDILLLWGPLCPRSEREAWSTAPQQHDSKISEFVLFCHLSLSLTLLFQWENNENTTDQWEVYQSCFLSELEDREERLQAGAWVSSALKFRQTFRKDVFGKGIQQVQKKPW